MQMTRERQSSRAERSMGIWGKGGSGTDNKDVGVVESECTREEDLAQTGGVALWWEKGKREGAV